MTGILSNMQSAPRPSGELLAVSDVLAARVKLFRDRRGWSAARLAEECARCGAPDLTAAAIANIETGRRDKDTGRRRRMVTVDEWLVLAYALAVPPVLLLVPLRDANRTPITPTVAVPPALALSWIRGDRPPLPEEEGAPVPQERVAAWREASRTLRLESSLGRAYDAAAETAERVRWAQHNDPERAERAGLLHEEALRRLAEVVNAMVAEELVIPPIPSDWRAAMFEHLRRPDLVPDAGQPYLGGA